MALVSGTHSSRTAAIGDRVITIGAGLPPIPERLLLAHSQGKVLFVAGAGISRAAGMPDFRQLVLNVYEKLDTPLHAVISAIPSTAHNQWPANFSGLTSQQAAEVRRFIARDYDVVLGMLERRMDKTAGATSSVRAVIAELLTAMKPAPTSIHRSLMRLADRGVATVIVTTNFECLLEDALKAKSRAAVPTLSLAEIPRPGMKSDFAGVLHIHGAIDRKLMRASDVVISDHDFGEFYLRRRVVPDFIYDAARLYNIVLVGYSANDPPMRYLLNAVAVDGQRFQDVKERFVFQAYSSPDPVQLEDWRSRGITPIHYSDASNHAALVNVLDRWAELSSHNGRPRVVEAEIRRIVATARSASPAEDRDLFDHLLRRVNSSERVGLIALASRYGADTDWLNAALGVISENPRNIA